MRRKMKATLIAFLLAILSLFVFAGCSLGETLEEVLETRNLSPRVTYYSNGGLFESNSVVKDIYYPVGAKALDIGKINPTSGSVDISRRGFEIVGWHIAEEVDEETGLCELGDEWDFTTKLEEGEHIILAAKWRALVGLQVVMVCDPGETITVGKKVERDATLKAESFKNGDLIGSIEYDTKETVSSSATPEARLFTVKDKSHTFYGYYEDAACTKEVSWPIQRGAEEKTVYAKYITGNWTLVKTSDDVYKMFDGLKGGTQKNYWICNDIAYRKNATISGMTKFAGEIRGNGYTISDLKFSKSLKKTLNTFSIFGDMQETAKVTDLTLSNVQVSVTLSVSRMTAQVYLAFMSKAEGATVSNVKISMAETDAFVIDGYDDATVTNIHGAEGATYTSCLYGGYETDAEYIEEADGKGFTVVGKPEEFITLKI